MTPEQLFVALVVVALVAAIIQGRIKISVLFAAAAFLFYVTGFVSTSQLTTQMTNPGVITLLLLMLCSVVLNKSRFLDFLTSRVLRGSCRWALTKLVLLVGLNSALLNNTAVVASLIGPIKSAARDTASRLLLPMAYAATLGGMLTLIGTSTNLLISGFVQAEGLPALHLLAPLPMGLLLFGACTAMMLLFYPRLLPARALQDSSSTDYWIEARVLPSSSLVGRSVAEAGLRKLGDLFLLEIVRGERLLAPVTPFTVLQAEDRLVFSGDVRRVDLLAGFQGLEVIEDTAGIRTDNLLEVMISGESVLRNRSVKQVDFRARFDAAVLAVRRSSRQLRGNLATETLQAGDILVLVTGPDFESRNNLQRNFIPISRPIVQRFVQAWQSWLALGSFVLTIFLAALGWIELIRGLLVLIVLYLATGLVTVSELRRNLPWNLLITISSALVVSLVMSQTGLAHWLVTQLLAWVPLSPWTALVVVLVGTALMTELMTNNAAAALMFPLALSTANSMDVSYLPFVMAVLYGASASFLTPHGYQTNLMVMSAGGYRPLDYLRAGSLLTPVYLLLAACLLPLFFPF